MNKADHKAAKAVAKMADYRNGSDVVNLAAAYLEQREQYDRLLKLALDVLLSDISKITDEQVQALRDELEKRE